MEKSFLQAYLQSFQRIDGWFSFDAALVFMAYHQLLAPHGIAGDVLEIGVHHGLSTIAVASLRGPGASLCAIDIFDRQDQNVSRSGEGNREIFERNMRSFYPDLGFVKTFPRASSELAPGDLGSGFSFCHVDGGHSRTETYNDLKLCHEVLAPGGLVALDDYFNVEYPGVCEGAVQFMIEYPKALRPLGIGYNKVIFQKQPAAQLDLNQDLLEVFPMVKHKMVTMWDTPVILFTSVFRSYLDLYSSSPVKLVPLGGGKPRAAFAPASQQLRASRGESITLPVSLRNTSDELFPSGKEVLGMSYHLVSSTKQLLSHDNERTWIQKAMRPGEQQIIDLRISAPTETGRYSVEIDLVWEGVMWFKDIGNPTAVVDMVVS